MSSPTPPAYPTYVPAPPQATTQKSAPSLRELLQAEPLKNATRPHSAINTHALMSVESQKRKQDEALYSSKDAGNKRPRQDVTNMPRKAMPQLARQQYHRWAQSSAHVPPNISYAHSPPISAFEYPHLPGAEQYRQQQFGPALDLGAHGSRTSPSRWATTSLHSTLAT